MGQFITEGLYGIVSVDLSVYSCSAVLKAAHKVTRLCYVHVQRASDSSLAIVIRPKLKDLSLEDACGEYLNELLDQRLREIVAEQSEPLRNLIVAHALSDTTFFRADLEDVKEDDDPLEVTKQDAPI